MEQRLLEAHCYMQDATSFVGQLETFDTTARWRRALGIAALLVGGAIVSVPVPGWHFLGVPGFLVGAVVMARKRLAQHYRLHCAEGPCPACSQRTQLQLPAAAKLPVTLACPSCGEFLKLSDLR